MRHIGIVIAVLMLSGMAVAETVTVTRDLPASGSPSGSADVTLSLVKGDNPPNSVIITEYVPSGWSVTSTSPTYSTYNSSTGEIKWVLWGGDFITQDITYTVGIPADASASVEFSGQYLYNDPDTGDPATITTSGETTLEIVVPTINITITRNLPDGVMTGNDFDVTLSVVIDTQGLDAPSGLTIHEFIPVGWNLSSASPTQTDFTSGTGEIRWVIYGAVGLTDMSVNYTAAVPEDATGTGAFSGNFSYNNGVEYVTASIIGDSSVAVTSVPGDTNGDNEVSDFELLAYIDGWSSGEVDDFDLLSAIDVWASG